MVMTTVLADCPTCQQEREVRLVDCDSCYEAFLEKGGDSNEYDGERDCPHLQCLTCEEDLGA